MESCKEKSKEREIRKEKQNVTDNGKSEGKEVESSDKKSTENETSMEKETVRDTKETQELETESRVQNNESQDKNIGWLC